MILDKINNPNDLKKLNIKDKIVLAKEIRDEILNVVSKNGGHLASNLGIVELTIALLSTYNLPKDKIIFDVGHQTYAYKLLTGRRKEFYSLRKKDGIAGFPRCNESIYDNFDTGHASTSISLALGMARARNINKGKEKIIAVIGDGALTGGLALEALNDAGISKTNLIVILNDNTMSISKNTGGISKVLTHLRTRKSYIKVNKFSRKIIINIPIFGKYLYHFFSYIKKHIKGLLIKNMYFENLGFTYLGLVDGHNIHDLEEIFKRSNLIDGPILIHVVTEKGRGYDKAMINPSLYHAVGPFNLKDGVMDSKKNDYSSVVGEKLIELAKRNKKIVAITAAMEEGCGLKSFHKAFPNRFFDVEICEEHAVTMAAGMAKNGLIPVVIIYSTFMQRAYDEIIHDICLNNLHVILLLDRAGIVGNDGTTHQGILDISYLNTIPNLVILSPSNYKELRSMLDFAISYNGPIAIRYPKGCEEEYNYPNSKIIFGKSLLIKEGRDITIIAVGRMVAKCIKVANLLQKDGINASIIDVRFIKPLDIDTIKKTLTNTSKIVTVEDNITYSGFGNIIKNYFNKDDVLSLGYPDKFIEHATISELDDKYHLDTESIYQEIKKFLNKKEN